jgi:pyruvate/2-oxoglutarate dehydrogenase complex dihydrolipoamide dehydrogenase (E3) component
MATVPRARIVDDPRGVMKAVVDAETDEILGVTMLSHDAHETINTVAVAMRHGVTASEMRDEIYTHPSMTEAFNDLFANLRPA